MKSRGEESEPAISVDERALAVASKVARVMDRLYIDPLLGLALPWAGDLIGAAIGLFPVLVAWRRKAPKTLLARMLLNLTVDVLTGLIPVFGDIWDFFFRANTRNLELLRSRLRGGEVRASARDSVVVGAALALFVAALAAPVVLLWVAISSIVR